MNQIHELLDRLGRRGMGKRAVRKLGQKAVLFLHLPENQDGRGTKVQARKTAITTLRHLNRAQQYCNSSPDQQIRKLAQKLVKSTYHEDFATIVDLGRKFCGLANRRVAAIREQQKRESEKQVLSLRHGYELEKITTSEFLQSIGRTFKNCLAHPRGQGQGYHQDLRRGGTEFWLLSKKIAPLCIISIDISARSIEECQGLSGEDPQLSRLVALDICDKLNATGDDIQSFADVGAFGIFRSSIQTPRPSEIMIQNKTFRVWAQEGELVIRHTCEGSKKNLWSKFGFDDGEFEVSWHSEMNIGHLLALAVASDELRDALSQVRGDDPIGIGNRKSLKRRRGRRYR